MRKKKKVLLGIGGGLCIVLAAIILSLAFKEDRISNNTPQLITVDEAVDSGEASLIESKYTNLVFDNFVINVGDVKEVYNIEILKDKSYQERTFLENFDVMNNVIDKFFQEDFDKSNIVADFNISDEETIYVDYYDIEKECTDEKYNMPRSEFLFCNETSNGGYMVQIDESLSAVWFSRYGLGDIQPSGLEYKKVYPYISCIRPVEDVEINLQDGSIKLSEMEERVLSFLNENFPMAVSENISFGIGDVRILDNGDYDGVCFKVRRIYKGIPFEYGSTSSGNIYIDKVANDRGEVSYATSEYPDTMLAFGRTNGTVVETAVISEMISWSDALDILSKKIGENSVYDVHGVELVYRACAMSEEQADEFDAILKPNWKIITINQNDDKYTLFYVDVVTGEVTERFEYYYE